MFGRVVGDDFIPEDLFRIEEGVGFARWVAGAGGSVPTSFFRPVGWLYASALYGIFGLTPAPYYAVGLALHALAGALLYLLIRTTTGASAPAALLAGAFFVVSPAQAGVVFWIPTYFNVIAHVAGIGLLLLVWRAVQTGHRVWLAAAVAVYTVGILAYATLAAIVPVVALLAYHASKTDGAGHRRRVLWSAARAVAPFVAVTVAFAVVERMRGSFGARWTAGPLQALKNLVVFASIPYYPFTRFGITESMDAGATSAVHALAGQPLAIVMLLLAGATLVVVATTLLRSTPVMRAGATLFTACLLVYLPYRAISSRFVGFAIIGLALILGGALARAERTRARGLVLALVAALVIGEAWVAARRHAQYHAITRTTTAFRQAGAGAVAAGASRLVVCEARQVAVEDATLIPWIVTTRAHWLPGGIDLDVTRAPCPGGDAAATVTFRFVAPGRLERP